MKLTVIFILVIISGSQSSRVIRRPFRRYVDIATEKTSYTGDDPGEPLILTPLIEEGKIDEAKKQSKVDETYFQGVESYSGFLTVNKAYNSTLYFWFFPAENDYAKAPVALWLQGGPGGSSLFGLFVENGPFKFVDKDTLVLRNESWHKNQSLIFIDNPAGTGFSFTSNDGYCRNQTQVGKDLYEGIKQFFTLFPELQKNDFFITGESYAGKYIPALAYTIHQNNPSASTKINLQGLAIGDGYSDPRNQHEYADFLYQTGLIDINQREYMKTYEQLMTSYIDAGWYSEAVELFGRLMDLYTEYSGGRDPYNYLVDEDPTQIIEGYVNQYFQNSTIRKALHVGNLTYHTGDEVHAALYEDMGKSVAPWISELLSHYRILIYSGQVDVIVAYPLTLNYLQNLKFSGADDYKIAKRKIWRVDKELAGYVKTAGNLTELLVRDAGHMVPFDQPKWSFDLIYKFTRNITFAN